MNRMKEAQAVEASGNYAAVERVAVAAGMLNLPSLWHPSVPLGCLGPRSACICINCSTSTDCSVSPVPSCPEVQLMFFLLAAVRCVQ